MQPKVELKAGQKVDITLNTEEWMLIVNALLDRPMREVRHTIESIEMQLVASVTPENQPDTLISETDAEEISKEDVDRLMKISNERKKPKELIDLQKEVRSEIED